MDIEGDPADPVFDPDVPNFTLDDVSEVIDKLMET